MSEELTHFGLKQIPVAEKRARVAGVFSSVAGKYDVMNDIMSLGTHRLMKRYAVEMTAVRPGDCVLDLAGGTGDLTLLLSPLVGDSGRVILCDINPEMMVIGRDRLIDRGVVGNVSFIQGDAEFLPFAEASFDAITIAFGLRNVTDKAAALAAMYRVLKPGGRLVVLEFSTPRNPLLRGAYEAFASIWPDIGRAITGDRDSYQYLVESIKVHPDQEALLTMVQQAGFMMSRYHNLADGVAAIHFGIKG